MMENPQNLVPEVNGLGSKNAEQTEGVQTLNARQKEEEAKNTNLEKKVQNLNAGQKDEEANNTNSEKKEDVQNLNAGKKGEEAKNKNSVKRDEDIQNLNVEKKDEEAKNTNSEKKVQNVNAGQKEEEAKNTNSVKKEVQDKNETFPLDAGAINSPGIDGKKKKASKLAKKGKSQSKPTQQKGIMEVKTNDASNTSVSPGNTATISVPERGEESQPEKKRQARFRAVLLSWEVSCKPIDIAACLTNDMKISDCCYIALSPPTKDSEWTPPVDQSSIVIFYSSPNSEKPLYEMEHYLEYCVNKKGSEKVIVVIGEEDDAHEEWTTKWQENQLSKTLHQQFRFSRAELECITGRDTPLHDMLEKIGKMRKTLISHSGLQQNPTGDGPRDSSAKEMPKENKQNKEDKASKQKSNKKDKPNKATKLKSKKESALEIQSKLDKVREEMAQNVRIVSWSPNTDSDWLQTLLRSPYFQDSVEKVETINVITNELEKITDKTSSITTLILYFSPNSLSSFSSQLNNNATLLSNLEKKKIIVVIDNVDNKATEEETTRLSNNPPISNLSRHVLLFRKEEKETDYPTYLKVDKPATVQRWSQLQDVINRRIVQPDPPGLKIGTVGIFSRSAESDYAWLEKLLKSQTFQGSVDDVRSCYVSNRGYEEFYQGVNDCDFGILYHTKNRGRINITDVTDSLYDMEIEHLSSALGRYKVLVIVDDLKDSSLKEKERILKSQPSIQKYARNLLLVTEEEKKDEEMLLCKVMEILVSPATDEPENCSNDFPNKNDEKETNADKAALEPRANNSITGNGANDKKDEPNKGKASDLQNRTPKNNKLKTEKDVSEQFTYEL